MRALGALVAATVGAVLVAGQVIIDLPIGWPDPNPFALIAPFAVPIGALLALRHARRVASSPDFDMLPVVFFAFQAVVAGALAISAVVSVGAAFRGVHHAPIDAVVGFVQLTLLGSLYAGLPVFVFAWVCAIVWALVLRWLVRPLSGSRRAQGRTA